MNDFETLEELREMYHYAEIDEELLREKRDEAIREHEVKAVVLHKARKRYLAHLEMMAAGVKQ